LNLASPARVRFSEIAKICVRVSELLHLAYAVELAAEALVSFDDEQLKLAGAAGLRKERPATRWR
jgi:hypothetical protein